MLRRLLVIGGCLAAVLSVVAAQPGKAFAQSQAGPQISAKLLTVSCEHLALPKDSKWPTWKEDKPTVEKRVPLFGGCNALEDKFGKVAGVMTTFTNGGSSDIEVPLESLGIVTVTKEGKKQAAVGMYWRTYFSSLNDYVYGVTPGISGTLTMVVPPGEKSYVVFFFLSSSLGETIQIGKLAPVKITSE